MTLRRVALAATLCFVVVLAGCGGGGLPANPGNAPGGTDTTVDGGPESPDGGSNGPSGDSGQWEPLQFDQEATYTYDVFLEGQGEGRLVWEVVDTSGEGATVSVHYELGETTYDATISGTRDDIRGQLAASPAGQFFLLGVFSPTLGYYENRELAVGNSWSVTTQDGSASFEVTSKDSYAGVECFASEMRVDGTLAHEGCFSPDVGLMPYTAYYDDTGTLQLEMTLVEYTEG